MTLLWFVLGSAGICFIAYIFNVMRVSAGRSSGTLPGAGKATIADVERLVREGRRIDAIRCYREIHRCGLAEAKEAVDKYPH
jgi:ribosomal protein L7/L12